MSEKLRHIYYRLRFQIACRLWPLFQMYVLRRKIQMWKMDYKIWIINPEHKVKVLISK